MIVIFRDADATVDNFSNVGPILATILCRGYTPYVAPLSAAASNGGM
jgi:hypothetical protein